MDTIPQTELQTDVSVDIPAGDELIAQTEPVTEIPQLETLVMEDVVGVFGDTAMLGFTVAGGLMIVSLVVAVFVRILKQG